MTVRRGIVSGEYYHVFNRGAHKTSVFKEKNDYVRFLFDMLYGQSALSIINKTRFTKAFSDEFGFQQTELAVEVLQKRTVELVAFCIMPNHFHLIVKEKERGGMALYLQRISEGYTKYFNAKYRSSGHVFQGRYRSVHVKDDRQLTYLSAYIHRNPRELRAWKNKEFEYPWSSLQDYTKANRWGGLIVPDIIASQFDATSKSNYADFVRTSTAKIFEEEIGETSLS